MSAPHPLAGPLDTSPSYNVHLYCLVRLKVIGVRAASPLMAIHTAEERLDLQALFRRLDRLVQPEMEVEFAEELAGYLVDEVRDPEKDREKDPEHERSRSYCRHRRPLPENFPDGACEPSGGVTRSSMMLARAVTGLLTTERRNDVARG